MLLTRHWWRAARRNEKLNDVFDVKRTNLTFSIEGKHYEN